MCVTPTIHDYERWPKLPDTMTPPAGTTWGYSSEPLTIGRCESCRRPDRGLYLAIPLVRRTREPLDDTRPFEVCVDCI